MPPETVEAVLLVAAGALGLAFGSFANVVISRVPEGASMLRPRSACPACGRPIRGLDLVPVVSWVVLRGRCRGCRAPIGARHPLVEAATAALFVAVAWRLGADPALPAFWLLAWTLVCVAAIDATHHRIPNRLTYPLTPALALLLVAAGLVDGQPGAAGRALLGGLVAFGALLLIALLNPRGMGLGDVKLAALIGLGLGYLGWGHLVLGLFAGFLAGGVVAVALLASGRRGRRDHIPFGPWLAAGALVAVLFGETLVGAYLRAAGLA